MTSKIKFLEVWFLDFEFNQKEGDTPTPICLVAKELHSQQTLRFWVDDLENMTKSPFDENSLLIAYYAVAEINCFLALKWLVPNPVIDLFAEFRNITNQKKKFCGDGLIGALSFFGLDSIGASEKSEMQNLAIRGGPWTPEEKGQLLEYCESDVISLEKLFRKMLPYMDLSYAQLRGEYVKSIAQIESNGIPIDSDSLNVLKENWDILKEHLINQIDADYGVFEKQVFKAERFKAWLEKNRISWPFHPTGSLKLDEKTFADMAKINPIVEQIRQLKLLLSKMRATSLSVGSENRNRCMLSIFSSKTGRNQPSSTKFIFGPSVWLRSLIKPPTGHSLAYIDWSQQEFGIAAALSGDEKMKAAYLSEDPYLEFAKMAKAVPENAKRGEYDEIRGQYKQCALAVQYGMGPDALAIKIQKLPIEARELLNIHKKTFSTFWEWSDRIVDYANFNGKLHTVFDWKIHTEDVANSSSLRNFPMQANGSEIMRLASIYGIKSGIKICAPVHDAFLIEAPTELIEEHTLKMQKAMSDASSVVLNGFRLKSDVKFIHYPDRYMDKRGLHMWETAWKILDEIKKNKPT